MRRGAFSLIELMIVIVIVGVVYTLAVQNLKAPHAESSLASFANLKEYLLGFSKEKKGVTLRCLDSCQACSIYSDGEELAKIESFFDASIEVYHYDFFQGVRAVENEGCFEFSVDGDGVSEQLIVVYKERVYDYTDYFRGTQVYDSLTALSRAKEELIEAVE